MVKGLCSTIIQFEKVVEFPGIQNTEETGIELQLTSNDGVVRITDDHEKDTNNNLVVVKKILIEQQHEVSVPTTDTPSIGVQQSIEGILLI